MKKQIILFLLILCTFINFTPSASAFEFAQTLSSDIDEHWSEEAMGTMASLGIMNGYNGFVNPDNIITRGEFTALITRAFELASHSDTSYFKDISQKHIFFENINAAYEHGIIDGFEDGTFRSENMISREEIVLIISRLSGDAREVSQVKFSDISPDYPYMTQLSAVSADKIINGYPDGSFRPYAKTTRAEAATIVLNAMKKYITPPSGDSADVYAERFLNDHFANIHSLAEGSAKKDSEYIEYTYQKAKSLGYSVTNKISYISIVENTIDGPFCNIKANYVVDRYINSAKKTYTGQSDIKLIARNGGYVVYEHSPRIIKHGKINLTWEIYSNPPTEPTPGINVVSPTCFVLSDESEYGAVTEKMYNENGEEFIFNSTLKDSYVNYARNNGYEIWAMYKTNFDIDVTTKILNSPALRKQSADILIENILRYTLDGINFDFENMYKSDKGAYTNHVKEIAVMARVLGATVSADVTKYEPTSYTWSMCYDRDALAKIVDYIAIMAYDQYYSGSKTPGPVAGMGWTEDVVRLTLKEVPPDKLLLGVPYYIRCWQTHNGKVVKSEALSMSKAMQYVADNNAKSSYDSAFGLTKYSWTKDGKTYCLWMENAQTIGQRAQIANKYSLAGVASWRRGFETNDVWNVLKSALGI